MMLNNRYEIAKHVFKVLSVLGWIIMCIGIVLAGKYYGEIGLIGLFNGGFIAISGVGLFISSQIGLATIETAENTYQILMKMQQDSKSTGITSRNAGTARKKLHPNHATTRGALEVGDPIKVFKGYAIIKSKSGCSIDGKPFDNILEAERWVYRNPK